MTGFPEFLKNPINAVRDEDQSPGVKGYIFDGLDGSQVILWESQVGVESDEHVHDFDEYFVIVEGEYSGVVGGRTVSLKAGDELLVPRGTPHSGKFPAGSRFIYAFSGRRARRAPKK